MKNQRWNSRLLFVNMQDYSMYFHSEVVECKVGRAECIFPDGVKRQNKYLSVLLDVWSQPCSTLQVSAPPHLLHVFSGLINTSTGHSNSLSVSGPEPTCNYPGPLMCTAQLSVCLSVRLSEPQHHCSPARCVHGMPKHRQVTPFPRQGLSSQSWDRWRCQ